MAFSFGIALPICLNCLQSWRPMKTRISIIIKKYQSFVSYAHMVPLPNMDSILTSVTRFYTCTLHPQWSLSFQLYMLLLNQFTFLCFNWFCLCMYLFSLRATIYNKSIVIVRSFGCSRHCYWSWRIENMIRWLFWMNEWMNEWMSEWMKTLFQATSAHKNTTQNSWKEKEKKKKHIKQLKRNNL